MARRAKKSAVAEAIMPGYLVAVALRKGSAPLRCYAGQVQHVDEHGVRITLMDWVVGAPVGWDFFVPWGSITASLVATPGHNVEGFGEAAAQFQQRCEELQA